MDKKDIRAGMNVLYGTSKSAWGKPPGYTGVVQAIIVDLDGGKHPVKSSYYNYSQYLYLTSVIIQPKGYISTWHVNLDALLPCEIDTEEALSALLETL